MQMEAFSISVCLFHCAFRRHTETLLTTSQTTSTRYFCRSGLIVLQFD